MLRSGASEYHYETQVARLSCFTLIEKPHLKPRSTLGPNAQSTHSTNKSNYVYYLGFDGLPPQNAY